MKNVERSPLLGNQPAQLKPGGCKGCPGLPVPLLAEGSGCREIGGLLAKCPLIGG